MKSIAPFSQDAKAQIDFCVWKSNHVSVRLVSKVKESAEIVPIPFQINLRTIEPSLASGKVRTLREGVFGKKI
jgi:hypothetical protein